MKRWLLGLTLLMTVVYFRLMPPPRYSPPADVFADHKEDNFHYTLTFRTFPTCDIFVHDPESKESFGSPWSKSNSPTYLTPSTGGGIQVYYIYSQQARDIIAKHPTDWFDQEHLEIPSENLRRNDLNWDVWPPSYLPKFLLTSPSAWATCAGDLRRQAWAQIRSHWLITLTGSLGIVFYLQRLRQTRQRRQELSTATQVGEFVLYESLGKGGAGEVFRALDEKGQPVALKILHASAQENPELHKRFQAEIKICSRLNHPNIVRLIDWGKQNDILYLAMELLEGESLGTRLRREKRLRTEDFLAMLMPLASALQSLHDQGLVHRDLKPDNIFLRQRRGPALMDFGIAAGEDVTRATRTGLAVGTPSYMAPEQIRGLFEPATDQYALGVVSFVCLTGRRPFEAEDAAAMAYQHAHAWPPAPSSLNAELSPVVDGVILKMLSKSPGHRYSSIQAAALALQDVLSGSSFLDEDTLATSS